jgi:hypothetical protein
MSDPQFHCSPRPLYETDKDIKNEISVANLIESSWGLTAKKMPMSYHLDYALMDSHNKLRGFAEVKTRTVESKTFDTYLISLSKIIHAKKLTEATGLSCVLIVKWTDIVNWVNFDVKHTLGFSGRSDRDDWQDQEPVAYLPMNKFKPLEVTGLI